MRKRNGEEGMDVGKYEAFLRVAELGNLTRAAEELGYTQSAVSRIVADLEREWGVRLLTRSRTGVALTTAGEDLLPRLRAVCDAQRELEQRVGQLHGLTFGTVRVGTFASTSVHWLPRIMKSFLARYPNIRFEIVSHIEYREIEDMIASGRVDCGFIALPAVRELETLFLSRDMYMAVLPADHPLAGAERYPMARFAQDPFIKLEDERDREVADIMEHCHVRPNLRYQVNDDYAVMSMVESGLGVSTLTGLVVRRTPYRVATLPLDPPQFRDIGLAARSFRGLSPAAARFVEYVKEWVEQEAT